MYQFEKQRIAVIGAAGQIGKPLTQGLLSLGHDVVLLCRTKPSSLNPQLLEFQNQGAELIVLESLTDKLALSRALIGCDTLICAVPGSKSIITHDEPLWLEAAVEAGVNRFVPTEFGAHTQAIEYGEGEIFDHKKALHQKIFDSGIGWTFFYNGGIFDYFLPNLRFFDSITTFGDMSFPIYTHHINDIGYCAALALTDKRTLNHCVQMDFYCLSQTEMLQLLESNFPNHPFEYHHYSTAYISLANLTSGNEVSAKKGAETDKERWGINNVIYVLNKLVAFNEDTLRTSDLFPDFQLSYTVEQALSDPLFVFEEHE